MNFSSKLLYRYDMKTKKQSVATWFTVGDFIKVFAGGLIQRFGIDLSFLSTVDKQIESSSVRITTGTQMPKGHLNIYYLSDNTAIIFTGKKLIRYDYVKKGRMKKQWVIKNRNIILTDIRKGDALMVINNGRFSFLNLESGDIAPIENLNISNIKGINTQTKDSYMIITSSNKISYYNLK